MQATLEHSRSKRFNARSISVKRERNNYKLAVIKSNSLFKSLLFKKFVQLL